MVVAVAVVVMVCVCGGGRGWMTLARDSWTTHVFGRVSFGGGARMGRARSEVALDTACGWVQALPARVGCSVVTCTVGEAEREVLALYTMWRSQRVEMVVEAATQHAYVDVRTARCRLPSSTRGGAGGAPWAPWASAAGSRVPRWRRERQAMARTATKKTLEVRRVAGSRAPTAGVLVVVGLSVFSFSAVLKGTIVCKGKRQRQSRAR